MKKITIAIDGPAGSGKSTTARLVAEKLGYLYIDTGAMYRAVTLFWLQKNEDFLEERICSMIKDINIEIRYTNSGQRTFLNGKDVSEQIRLPEVTKFVSPISAIQCVRELLVRKQRELGKDGGVVMDGRDIGTVVFPNAELKIFLVASEQERAHRRALELKQKGIKVPIDEILKQLKERDNYDSSRNISPLKKAEDAIVIDTSNLTIEEQTDIIINLAKKII